MPFLSRVGGGGGGGGGEQALSCVENNILGIQRGPAGLGPFQAVGVGLWAVSKVESSARTRLAFQGLSCRYASVTPYF